MKDAWWLWYLGQKNSELGFSCARCCHSPLLVTERYFMATISSDSHSLDHVFLCRLRDYTQTSPLKLLKPQKWLLLLELRGYVVILVWSPGRCRCRLSSPNLREDETLSPIIIATENFIKRTRNGWNQFITFNLYLSFS